MAEEAMEPAKEVDIYRDTYLRYIGYTNEVGEACRPLVHKHVVTLSYVTASLYVLADVRDKWTKTKASYYHTDLPKSEKDSKAFCAALDTLVWQGLASIAIPGLVINRFVATNYFLLKKFAKLPKQTRKYASTALGLLCIPFIIHPIDNFTTYAMDKTVRKLSLLKTL